MPYAGEMSGAAMSCVVPSSPQEMSPLHSLPVQRSRIQPLPCPKCPCKGTRGGKSSNVRKGRHGSRKGGGWEREEGRALNGGLCLSCKCPGPGKACYFHFSFSLFSSLLSVPDPKSCRPLDHIPWDEFPPSPLPNALSHAKNGECK